MKNPWLIPAATAVAAVLAGTAPARAQSGAPVANATAVDGTAYVTRADGRTTVLARGTALAVGDALSTTRNSTVRLRFTDGGETALRPDSRLTVLEYSYQRENPQGDSLVLSLLKGGLRAITGSIGKRGNVDAYKLNVSTATVGIRGTDFTARLCNGDCPADVAGATGNTRSNSGPPVIARVLQAQGNVSVERDSRRLEIGQGAPLYATDKVATTSGSSAVLGFRDETRVTLNSGTQLALAQFQYDAAQPVRGNMLLQLLSGGLRVATGLIGKAAPRMVRVQTTTATIGIRGTVFDLSCGKADAGDDPAPADVTDLECNQALYASTRSGAITIAGSDGRETVVPAGQAGLVPASGSSRALAATPAFFNSLSTPQPETVDLNTQEQFGGAAAPADAPGVYLLVREGRVVMGQAGQTLQLDAGESAFAGQSVAPVRLASPPLVLDRDPALSNRAFNFNICRP